MALQTVKQIKTVHTLPNISRGQGNYKKKFGQLMEYNMRNNFLQKSKVLPVVSNKKSGL